MQFRACELGVLLAITTYLANEYFKLILNIFVLVSEEAKMVLI